VDGATELTVTEYVCALLFPQPLPATTVTLPDELAKVTIIDVVPCPDVMVAPEGTVQL
jgi:hypothetical protein